MRANFSKLHVGMAQQTVTTAYINRVKLQDHNYFNNNNNEYVFGRLASMYRPCKGGLNFPGFEEHTCIRVTT